MRRPGALAAALAALMVALIGCGGGGGQKQAPRTTASNTNTSTTPKKRKRPAKRRKRAAHHRKRGHKPGTPNTGTAPVKPTKKPAPKKTPAPNQLKKKRVTLPRRSATVTIQNFAFGPARVTIRKGGFVTWLNKDHTEHTATSKSGPKPAGGKPRPPASPNIRRDGGKYTAYFSQPGTYFYICTIHPQMKGYVTVK